MVRKSIGQNVTQTCQLVATILHLGNIELFIDRSCNVGVAVVRNMDVLAIVAKFLGIQPSMLESTTAFSIIGCSYCYGICAST